MTDERQTNSAPTVLVVDDMPDIVEEMKEGIARAGFRTLTATSGQDALDCARRDPQVGIVVSDLRMPGMDGLAFAAALRRDLPAERDFQIIFVTGHGKRDDVVEALRLQAVDFLFKPVDLPAVLSAIRRAQALLEARTTERRRSEAAELALEEIRRNLYALANGPARQAGADAPPLLRRNDPALLADDPVTRTRLRKVGQLQRSFAQRQALFPQETFADHGWAMLIDLYLHQLLQKPVSVSSLCIASGLPTTTALRRVDGLIESGLIQRAPDPVDHRRTLLQIAANYLDNLNRFVDATPEPDAAAAGAKRPGA